jgi:hypothetical protein
MMRCSICDCEVTVPYRHPLGDGAAASRRHADHFYDLHPERIPAAQLKHKDVPNDPASMVD